MKCIIKPNIISNPIILNYKGTRNGSSLEAKTKALILHIEHCESNVNYLKKEEKPKSLQKFFCVKLVNWKKSSVTKYCKKLSLPGLPFTLPLAGRTIFPAVRLSHPSYGTKFLTTVQLVGWQQLSNRPTA